MVFIAGAKDVQKSGLITVGVSLSAVPTLERSGFREELASYISQPRTFKGLNEITSQSLRFLQASESSTGECRRSEQDVAGGVIQIVVNEFHMGEVRVEGNRWFSDKVVSAPFALEHGDAIDTQTLLGDLNAPNAYTFRRVEPIYQPANEAGYTDLVLKTQDRLPLTVDAGSITAALPSLATVAGIWERPGATPVRDQQFSLSIQRQR